MTHRTIGTDSNRRLCARSFIEASQSDFAARAAAMKTATSPAIQVVECGVGAPRTS